MTTRMNAGLRPSQFLTALLLNSAAIAALSGGVLLYGSAPVAAQQSASFSYAIASGNLTTALNRFADTSRIRLVYDASVTRGLFTNGVKGTMSAEAALSQLLSGSGISYHFTSPTSVTLNAPAPAATGNAGSVPEGAITLNTITIAGNSAIAAADATYSSPGSSTYLSQEKIELFRGTSTGDFLKGQAGIMTGDNRNSGAIDINIRGMQGFGRVPVVIDGAQQQNTVYRGYSGVASRNYVDPDMIGGVEIVKGPSAGVYGVGATGGVAVMRTLTADDIIKDGQDTGWRVRGSLMSNTSSPPPEGTTGGLYGVTKSYITGCNTTCVIQPIPDDVAKMDMSKFGSKTGFDRPAVLEPSSGSGSVAFAKRWENFELVAAYTRRKVGNYHTGTRGETPQIKKTVNRVVRPGRGGRPDTWIETTSFALDGLNRYRAGEEVLNTSQDNTSYLLKGKFMLEGGHTLDLGYMKYQSKFGELMPSVIIRGEGAVQAPLSDVNVDTYTARYNWKPDNNDLINLTANLWHTKTETDIRTPYEFFGDDYTQGYSDVAKRTGFDLSNETLFDTRWGDVTLNYGGSYTYETLAPSKHRPNTPDGGTLNARDGWRKETSGFISGEWKPLDWLKFDGTLRYTKTHSYDNALTRIPTKNPADAYYLNNEEKSSGFAPIAAVTIEPLDGLQFYTRYAEAIRAPNLFETTSGWSFDASPLLTLKPEHAKNWEFGSNLKLDSVFDGGDELRFKVAYFNNHIDNYLTRTIENKPGENIGSTTMRNLDYAKFKGYEISARYDNGWFFGEASGIYYTGTEFCTTEQTNSPLRPNCFGGGVPSGYAQMHLPPKKSGSVTLGTRWLDEALTVGSRVTYTGKRATELGNATSGGYTAGIEWSQYTLVDIFASYKINEDTTFDFNIDNLTDVYYMDALTLGLMPSPGRTFRASLTAKF